jgi:DNA-binding XRE family transcriptional regulator
MSIDQPIFVLRETADCPHCGLHAYLTENGECRRCHRPLGVEFIKLALDPNQMSDQEFHALMTRAGTAIRELRKKRSISQEKLAKICGTARSFLSRVECGHVRRPPLSILLALGLSEIILRFEKVKSPPTSRTEPHC